MPSTSRAAGRCSGIVSARSDPSSRATVTVTSCPSKTCTHSTPTPARVTNEAGSSSRHTPSSSATRAALIAASVDASMPIAASTARRVDAGTCTRSPKNDQYSVAML